ncbi:hypothetical protein KLP40_19150 [Hymenobacter sp. NST-14]|uniref:hypothetical protein n=1 Tax=Hymenobacter piscis TaxID=2839984 RepID=UPI001C036457|nr:hypothetical protein [Hymenobacter piscis]MBT9395292.1 hypothetical protein [Hymenobacter piscis]
MTNDDLQQASAWTRNYRTQNPDSINAHCLPAETLQGILAQDGCVGVRAYYGIDEAGTPKLVLVGYDANDNDILSAPSAVVQRSMVDDAETDSSGMKAASVQMAINPPPCPPCCSIQNPLNS